MIKRLFVEKKQGLQVSANKILSDIKNVLGINAEDVKEYIRYDIDGMNDENFSLAKNTIFSESPIDLVSDSIETIADYKYFVVEFLPGQYDQRADSAMQCVQLLTKKDKPLIKCARVIAIKGVNESEFEAIKKFTINPVEAREGSMDMPTSLETEVSIPTEVAILDGFRDKTDKEIAEYHAENGFAMSVEDLCYIRDYYKTEGRDPFITEIKVIDTYWSDHCRHTTFLTEIKSIKINSDNPHIKDSLEKYDALFNEINGAKKHKYKCLMDIAVIGAKKLVKDGLLDNMDISDEINACSIVVNVDNDGKDEEWLIMFKNETHNHPTEIEPYGGAATCLGGAIRDPLSGRVYVYQAMRVTGASDPRESFKDTLKGKLPQRVITTTATAGFSSYGNQIGLATGIVDEMYHNGFKAKRLETGYVIGGAPRENVVRRKPIAGDIIVLLGGDTGRDGCGGATGSSKAHTVDSVDECGAEVQKGNPLTERKIQRLFRNPKASKLIVKCNDFGAGGLSVAVGELADGIDLNLDMVPKKYAGLDGTELAISESQERMAIMLPESDVDEFIALASEENLKCTPVAIVTDLNRMRMFWNGNTIVDLCRDFLNTNGVKQEIDITINDNKSNYLNEINSNIAEEIKANDFKNAVLKELSRLNVCSKKGMSETFDSTIGAGSVLMPWGGIKQLTPALVMASKPPVSGTTDTATVSSWACYPYLNESSPYLGAYYSIFTSVSKLVASGVDYRTVRLSLQEFFKKLGKDSDRWGEPLSALLGALNAQLTIGVGAIGGKDSMSGTFEDIDVPPTLISFAVGISKASEMVTNVLSKEGNINRIAIKRDEFGMPDMEWVKNLWTFIADNRKSIDFMTIAEEGGATVALIKSALGNGKGFEIKANNDLFTPKFGDILIQTDLDLSKFDSELFATVNGSENVTINGVDISLADAEKAFTNTLENVYPTVKQTTGDAYEQLFDAKKSFTAKTNFAKPKVFIPVFPGTNCEYDTAKRFEMAGADAQIYVIKNQTTKDIENSVNDIAKIINDSQIIAFPGGFSGGDEPDGSGKFIATTFRNPVVAEAVMKMLNERDGLALGICNGFQALIKLGLVPYGEIKAQGENSPTLTYNVMPRHISTMSRIKVVSNNSPWLSACGLGDVYSVPVSHGEGRFMASDADVKQLIENGQVATQYVDLDNNVTMTSPFNPNGAINAIEGILSPDGRVIGKMGHAERIGDNLYRNYEDEFDMKIFESGVKYFK